MTEAQALILAFAFGCLFNWLIVRWGASGYGDGFTALWVVIGVFVTLLISDAGDRVVYAAAYHVAGRAVGAVESTTCRLVRTQVLRYGGLADVRRVACGATSRTST